MRKENVLTNSYLRINQHFADAINYYVFAGRQCIAPEDLHEMDTREDIVIEDDDGKIVMTAENFRDLLKYAAVKTTDSPRCVFALFGIENQTKTSFFAPPTAMIYDGMNYWKQRAHLWARHRDAGEIKNISGEEYISRFLASDRLVPVITVFVHWSSKPWTGCRRLHAMFGPGYPEEILKHVPDYRINLITPSEIKDFSIFVSELGKVMQIVAAEERSDQLKEIVEDQQGNFRHISKEAIQVINAVTDFQFKVNTGEEGTDVCKGVTDYLHEKYKEEFQEKDRVIQEKDSMLQKVIQEKDSMIQKVIQETDSMIQEKDSMIQEKDSMIQEKDSMIQEKDKVIEQLKKQLQDLQAAV
ncbi:MAG: hypothetical protein IKR99_04135 [Lachnospiraceae bacterium]|nr:hypothetical protein [Lachnospiraceae bacterium]